jgi:hypothetical protein
LQLTAKPVDDPLKSSFSRFSFARRHSAVADQAIVILAARLREMGLAAQIRSASADASDHPLMI